MKKEGYEQYGGKSTGKKRKEYKPKGNSKKMATKAFTALHRASRKK